MPNLSVSISVLRWRKATGELLGKINAGLQKIVADGTYAKIYKTWFDDNVPTLPAQ
ncbi:transporter substrate-binding domain-containing protein [Klebsiella pneumoniae]